MNSFKTLFLISLALLGGCNSSNHKPENDDYQALGKLIEFKPKPINQEVKIDSTVAASDTSAFPVIRKYQNRSYALKSYVSFGFMN